jgi:hypothetical protein
MTHLDQAGEEEMPESETAHLTADCVGDDLQTALPVSLDAITLHEGCADQRCRICLEHGDALLGELLRLTQDDSHSDLLGLYHNWLGQQRIPAETDGGWWSREAMSDANVLRFVAEHAAPTVATWVMPRDPELTKFINATPLVLSLLYDINLLPEQIDNARHWAYMVAVCEHMRAALALPPGELSGAVPSDEKTLNSSPRRSE